MALLSVSLEERWWLFVNRLEYRPQIEYKRQLKAKLKEYIQNSQLFDDMFIDEANLDADEFLPQDTVDDILYDMPISSVVKEAIEITPTDVLSKYIDAKEKLKQVIQYIETYAKEQKETVLGQYIDAYANEEWDKVKEIENWVDEEIVEIDNDVEEVMFEAYPMLKVLEDEWAEMEEVMIEELFPFEESTTAEEIFEDIERIRQEEELRLSSWFGQDLEIIKHMQSEEDVDLESAGVYIDHQEIQEDNHVCVFFDEQVDILKDYVYEIENLITNDEDEEAWEEVFELLDELVFEGDIAEEEDEDEDDDFTLDFSIFFDDSYDIDLDSLLSDSDVELEADAELETIEEGEEEKEKDKSFVSGMEFSKWLNNEFIPNNSEYSWIKEVSSKSVKQSIMNADRAFKRFFIKQSQFPKFKKKNKSDIKMYFVKTDAKTIIPCERHRIKIPTLGWVMLKEKGYIPIGKAIKSGTVSIVAGRYYISVLVEEDTKQELFDLNDFGIGVDLVLKEFAICSTGYYSTGHYSTGNHSTGNHSTGDYSTGDYSTGYYSTGHYSTGNRSTGNYSTGNYSTGDYSTGYYSTGHYSTGNHSTGNHSTGNYSTGDYSTGHVS